MARVGKALLVFLGSVNALPFSLLGGLVALVTLSPPYATRGPAIVFRMGLPVRWVVQKAAPGFGLAAFTWGIAIFTWADLTNTYRDDKLVKHELVHVRQAMVWGPIFPLLYLGSMLVAALQGKRPYRDCYFERVAYEEEVNGQK